MLKTRLVVVATLLAAALALPDPARAAAQAGSSQDGAGEPAQPQPQPRPPQQRGQAHEFIFVEGSFPFVPTSNTIATKLPLSLQLTPFNVGIVTAAVFEDQYATTVSQALVNISNVNVQPGNGVHDFFLIRGFDSLSSGLVMTDGAAEPEATFYDLYNVENVEVLKGPSGFLYGSNPLAGTVNLVRKQPVPVNHVAATLDYGRYDWIDGALDLNHGSNGGDFFVRLNALFRDTSGYRDRIEGRTFAINPAATWRIDQSASLNVNFEYVYANHFPDSGIPLLFNEVPPVARTNNYQTGSDTSDQDVYRLQADYQNQLSDAVTVRNKFYYRGLDWLSNGTLFNGAFPQVDPLTFAPTGDFAVSRNLVLLDDRQNWVGNQLEALVDGSTGTVHHNLVLGLEVARQADAFSLDVGFLPDIDLFAPQETFSGTPILVPGQSQVGDSRAIVAAPYAIDQIRLHERFEVLAGVRLDHIDFKDASSGVERTDTKASPMIGVTFTPTGDTSLYANYTRSFAPPAARVQTGDVKPEEGEQIEAGIKQEMFDRRARATVAVYQLERTNIGIPDANGITQQVGSQRSRGFEAELIGEPRNDLRFTTSYAFNSAELTEFREVVFLGLDLETFFPIFGTVDRSGNRPAFAPRHIFNAWVSKDFAGGFEVGGGPRYVSDQFIAEDNAFVIDGVLTFDAMASYAFRDVRVSLHIKNLTNREYERRGFGDNSVTPADPITVYAGVTFRR